MDIKDEYSTSDVEIQMDQKDEKGDNLLKSLSAYYSQFLETDFKAIREPKRKYSEKDGANRVGIRTSAYQKFRASIIDYLSKTDTKPIKVRYREHSAALSKTLKSGIKSAIDSINEGELTDQSKTFYGLCSEKLNNKEVDFELISEHLDDRLRDILDKVVVIPVLLVIESFVSKNSVGDSDKELFSFSDDIISTIIDEKIDAIRQCFGDILYTGHSDDLAKELESIFNIDSIKSKLSDYFSSFIARDLFVELRELSSTIEITENMQVYLNIGEATFNNKKFPLYYIPVDLDIKVDVAELTIGPSVYANKKAIEFLLGNLKKEHKIQRRNPISERIIHKTNDETHFDIINDSYHEILGALFAEGDINLKSPGVEKCRGKNVTLTNDLSLSIFDKSDESIVNDYEELMLGLDEDSPLLEAFQSLIGSFLTENPLSIEGFIEKEWDDTKTEDRLVFQSPLPLAEEQRKVLSAIRHNDSKFIIVEGPPGTGKSHTITAIAFELILKNKNVLILSDKKEALDVVEGKLNDVISKVRGSETEFVNPILRLGKSDSNFSKITKRSSIEKLSTSVKSFKADEKNFSRQYEKAEQGLKHSVTETIDSVKRINIDDILQFHEVEDMIISKCEEFDNFTIEDEEVASVISLVYDLVTRNRSQFNAIDRSSEGLAGYIKCLPILRQCDTASYSLLANSKKFDVNRCDELRRVLNELQSLRSPLFGYLFSGASVRRIASVIEDITGEYYAKPQRKLKQLMDLASAPTDVVTAIESFGRDASDCLSFITECIRSGLPLSDDSVSLLRQFDTLNVSEVVSSLFPLSINEMLQAEGKNHEIIRLFSEFTLKKKALTKQFESIPDLDYLKDKTDLESMNTLKLINIIDDRVTKFAINKKADAKTLKEIIANKSKFPTDKFAVLKDAFPCMIAGLRDFAEFIPLESNLFDLVVVDEASQVSIAQALPAILRAKKVLVLGDRKQFGNVKTANASKSINQSYFKEVEDVFKEEIGNDVSQMTRMKNFNVSHSVMDFFEYNSNFSIQLKKHFRGYPEMISFSSKYVYDSGLQALKIRGKPLNDVLEFVEVKNRNRSELIVNANRGEADYIFEQLESLVTEDEPPSVAIITPHKEQVKFLQDKVSKSKLRDDFLKKLKLAIFTFDSCQGEERDVIFYSMVATRQHDRLSYIFPKSLDLSEDEVDGNLRYQRLNVGFSRGKEKLVFVTSKPLEEFKGSIQRVLSHYQSLLDGASDLPDASMTDQSSPMEAQLLEWINATSFVSSNLGNIEVIPQFELGAYLKSLTPTYDHPLYKVDFLIRLNGDSGVKQCIVEYDGFKYHFTDRKKVDAMNWRQYLTSGDIERECVLESFGYKMLRVNRFNIGKDPVETLDKRLKVLFEELDGKDSHHETVSKYQKKATENSKGLKEGTYKTCSKCEDIKPLAHFKDNSLKSGYGRTCTKCKSAKKKTSRKSRSYY